MRKAKVLSFLMFLLVFLLLSAKIFHMKAAAEVSDEFKQILNDEGKLVVTDTTMSEDMTAFLAGYLGKYTTDEYYFLVNDYNETDSICSITMIDNREGFPLEDQNVEVVFEKNISDAFKSILKSGKLQVRLQQKII